MLAKKNRLTAHDFKNTGRFSLSRGIYFDAKALEFHAKKYACIMSAKNFKRSVDRSRIKRVFYRILREYRDKERTSHKGVLFYPKKEALQADPDLIKKELLTYLSNH